MDKETSPVPLEIELENREAIRYLYARGMSPRQIRYLKYPQIDPEAKIIYYEEEVASPGRKPKKKKVYYRYTPVERLLERPPISTVWVLYRRLPYKHYQKKLPTLIPTDCFYSETEILQICSAKALAREETIEDLEEDFRIAPINAPIFKTKTVKAKKIERIGGFLKAKSNKRLSKQEAKKPLTLKSGSGKMELLKTNMKN